MWIVDCGFEGLPKFKDGKCQCTCRSHQTLNEKYDQCDCKDKSPCPNEGEARKWDTCECVPRDEIFSGSGIREKEGVPQSKKFVSENDYFPLEILNSYVYNILDSVGMTQIQFGLFTRDTVTILYTDENLGQPVFSKLFIQRYILTIVREGFRPNSKC